MASAPEFEVALGQGEEVESVEEQEIAIVDLRDRCG